MKSLQAIILYMDNEQSNPKLSPDQRGPCKTSGDITYLLLKSGTIVFYLLQIIIAGSLFPSRKV